MTDLGSFNGTEVNEESIQSTLLNHDDHIKIGLNKLTFLTKKEATASLDETPILTSESYDEKDIKQIIITCPHVGLGDSEELLLSAKPQKGYLQRSNKVLFVLYVISRHRRSSQCGVKVRINCRAQSNSHWRRDLPTCKR